MELAAEVEVGNINEEYTDLGTSLEAQKHESSNKDHTYNKHALETATFEEKGIQTISRNTFNKSPRSLYDNYFSYASLSKNPQFKYFTGLIVQHFEALYKFLDPSVMPSLKYVTTKNKTPINKNRIKKLCDKDKLCLVLLRLKRGYSLKELSVFYKLSFTHTSVIFYTWIQFMYFQCCCIQNNLIKKSRNIERHKLPACFRKFKEHVTVVLDSTEIRMNMSKKFQHQGNTHFNAIKFLLGVSATGAVIYSSEAYEAPMPDDELFKHCDIQNFLEEGDVLMVDRGFTIQDICDENKYKLIIPPFLAGRSNLTVEEEVYTKRIAKARIHVKRAIRLIKTFRILVKPISMLTLPNISNIFSVICFLVNFEPPFDDADDDDDDDDVDEEEDDEYFE